MAVLEVNDIRKNFGKVEVLKGITFNLEEGKVLSLIGSSGSGKTTLLRCLNFLETPTSGEIKVRGETIYETGIKLSENQIRQNRLHFGLVFQQFNLFPQYTVTENLTLAAKLAIPKDRDKKAAVEEINEHAAELLSSVGLSDKKDLYPCQLSGGQQQRVAIARALMLTPDILCFDEPTSALDPELTGEVLNVIRKLADNNTTMIIVTHEMNFAREVSDKVVFLDDGVIAAEGTPKEVFDNTENERVQHFITALSK